jgi:hypothetical protein
VVAVSLNRNGSRFRKIAPGTFDLMMRDAKESFLISGSSHFINKKALDFIVESALMLVVCF